MRITKVFIIVSAFLFFNSTNATTLLKRDFNAICSMADGVIQGVVHSVAHQRNADGLIYRYIKLRDVNAIEGAIESSTITIRVVGGTIDDRTLAVIGSPEFIEGEEVILFVSDNDQRAVPFVGWGQGVFKVKKQNDKKVITDSNGQAIVSIDNADIVKGHPLEIDDSGVLEPPHDSHFGGIAADGTPVTKVKFKTHRTSKQPMLLGDFTTKIKSRVKSLKKSKPKKIIKSAVLKK